MESEDEEEQVTQTGPKLEIIVSQIAVVSLSLSIFIFFLLTSGLNFHSIKYPDPSRLDSATFIIRDEDHTLGNALRYVLMKK
jgi:hypothetical protein